MLFPQQVFSVSCTNQLNMLNNFVEYSNIRALPTNTIMNTNMTLWLWRKRLYHSCIWVFFFFLLFRCTEHYLRNTTASDGEFETQGTLFNYRVSCTLNSVLLCKTPLQSLHKKSVMTGHIGMSIAVPTYVTIHFANVTIIFKISRRFQTRSQPTSYFNI